METGSRGSGGHGGQADGLIMADGGESFQCHVASANSPLVVLLEHQRADETDDGGVVGEKFR